MRRFREQVNPSRNRDRDRDRQNAAHSERSIVPSYLDRKAGTFCSLNVEVKPQRACALSFLSDPPNFDSLPCEALR